ncbi:MAG: heme exporter protein CcmD [bacterium]|jgi:heme exporter protein D|nr:heme exporter protein CcmD [Betaproteobacteria bacterium]
MNWSSFSDFLAMGGYAFFVWMSYGVTALLVAAEVIWVVKQRRQSLARALVQRKIREWSST